MSDRVLFVVHRGDEIAHAAIYDRHAGAAAEFLIKSAIFVRGDCNASLANLFAAISGPALMVTPPADMSDESLMAASPGDAGVFTIDVDSGVVRNVDGYEFGSRQCAFLAALRER